MLFQILLPNRTQQYNRGWGRRFLKSATLEFELQNKGTFLLDAATYDYCGRNSYYRKVSYNSVGTPKNTKRLI